MEVTFKVTRHRLEEATPPRTDSFVIDVDPGRSVMEALVRVREEQDGSLAFRGACLRGFSGDCTMRANGRSIVACLVPVERAVNKEGEITIAAIKTVKVVKDALYDVDEFLWDKYRAVDPWTEAEGGNGHVSDEALEPVRVAMRCTMCGLCDEGCTVIEVDKTFLGPAALTKLYRTTSDPRDTKTAERFSKGGERGGMWDCVHCWEASEHCPWGIDPSHLIMEMRDQSIALGVKSGKGNKIVARHYDGFADSVRGSGWLNERSLVQKTYGIPPYGFSPSGIRSQMGLALKAIRRGKASLLPHQKRVGAEHIARVFKKVEEAQEKGRSTKRGVEG